MLKPQALPATHRPWPTSFHIPPRTLSLAPSANLTPGGTSITFKRIAPSCCHCSRIGSNGLIPRYVLKRSAMSRRQALPVPAPYRLRLALFSHPSSYSFPSSSGESSSRIRRNLNLFRENYHNIFLLALILGLIWNPNSIIICMIAALLVIIIPALCLGVIVALFIGLLSIPIFIISCMMAAFVIMLSPVYLVMVVAVLVVYYGVWLNLLVSLLIGVGIVALHATFW